MSAPVSRVWRQFGFQPHRSRSYMASNDPEFEAKAADIIGLYLKPPLHAAVFCVDEKSAIQALDRLDPILPLSPGRAERHGFEYYRHGTLSLYSALNTQTGDVLAKTTARHTSEEFVDFLAQIVDSQPTKRQIHVIADNLSAHKTKKVFEFLAENPTVRIHYTPTYSSWLNQVEIWFSKIQRDVIPAVSSLQSTTSRASSCATSETTTRLQRRSDGSIRMSVIESFQMLYESRTYCTSANSWLKTRKGNHPPLTYESRSLR
jgi:transposase